MSADNRSKVLQHQLQHHSLEKTKHTRHNNSNFLERMRPIVLLRTKRKEDKGQHSSYSEDSSYSKEESSSSTPYHKEEKRDNLRVHTLEEADEHMVYCCALALHGLLGESSSKLAKGELIWSEVIHPIVSDEDLTLDVKPSIISIFNYLLKVWESQELKGESAVMCFAYVERFLQASEFPLRPTNWRRIVLAAALISAKVWEDATIWNSYFEEQFPCLTRLDLQAMEREMLVALDFCVGLTASVYSKYFFAMRLLDKKNMERLSFPPFGTFSRVESRSAAFEEDSRNFKNKRSCTI